MTRIHTIAGLLIALTGVACGQPDKVKTSEPSARRLPPTPHPSVAPALAVDAAVADEMAWEWVNEPDLYPLADLRVRGEDALYVLGQRPIPVPSANGPGKGGQATLSRQGNMAWSVPLPALRDDHLAGAAMVVDDKRIYVAHYLRLASGCQLAAYASDDGRQLWSVPLEGIGPIGHSKYSNQVQLRLVDGQPRVFGSESGGRFIEARDAASGALVSNRRLESVPRDYPLANAVYYELALMLAQKKSHEIDVADFLARHVLDERYPLGDERSQAMQSVVDALRDVHLQGDRFLLSLELVGTSKNLKLRAARRTP